MGRLEAMLAGGVRLAEMSFGDPVETEEEMVESCFEVGLGGCNEGIQVIGVLIVRGEHIEGHTWSGGWDIGADFFDRGLEARHREVGEERDKQGSADALAMEGLKGAGRGRVLVAHAELDRNRELLLEQRLDLSAGVDEG